jgi:hypothetical protein
MKHPSHPLSVCPSANRSSFYLPHTETCQWGPHPPFVFTNIYALPGALILHWGTRFCILYIFPKIIYQSLYKHLHFRPFPLRYFGHHHWRPSFLFWPYATHVTLGWSITSHSPSPASSISSEYYQVTYHLSSEFVHLVLPLAQLILGLGVPLTLNLVNTVAATICFIHSPAKGSLESSHFLTLSMYLCHLFTSVDALEYLFASGSRVSLLSTSAHFSKRATVSWSSFPI